MQTLRTYFVILLFFPGYAFSQTYPAFGPEIKVTVTGLTFDAMEPFISDDESTLFFNSLNAGGNTDLYYASKINDSTFNYTGLVGGCYDSSSNHLDAVASLDSAGHFFWVSLRNWPVDPDNLHTGTYASGSVNNIHRVHGDFNVYQPGWLIMDGSISCDGNLLYYNNAYFNSCSFGMPCDARLGVAQKVNDSTFHKLPDTDTLFSNVNDTNYIVYAPQVTKDGLELYFTRIPDGTVNSEICVSVRDSITGIFSLPAVIHSNNFFVPEAASPTTDKSKVYYHQKDSSGIFHIYLRYRTGSVGLKKQRSGETISVFPNPSTGSIFIRGAEGLSKELFTFTGESILKTKGSSIDLSELPEGIYFFVVRKEENAITIKLCKTK
jgi:hypothetical protein